MKLNGLPILVYPILIHFPTPLPAADDSRTTCFGRTLLGQNTIILWETVVFCPLCCLSILVFTPYTFWETVLLCSVLPVMRVYLLLTFGLSQKWCASTFRVTYLPNEFKRETISPLLSWNGSVPFLWFCVMVESGRIESPLKSIFSAVPKPRIYNENHTATLQRHQSTQTSCIVVTDNDTWGLHIQ